MKNIVITGTDRGLGLSLTKKYLDANYLVFSGYLNDKTELEILHKKYADKLFIHPLDISLEKSILKFKNFVQANTDSIDILLNNAGILGDTKKTIIDDIDFEDISSTLNVNAIGTLKMMNNFIDLVLKSETKTIVNISSEAGSIEDNKRESWFGYCMSKAALNMASSIVHNRIKSLDARVILIHPGYMRSYMMGKYNDDIKAQKTDISANQLFQIINENSKTKIKSNPLYIDNENNILNW